MTEKRHKRITLNRRIARYSGSLKYLFRKKKPIVILRTLYNYIYYIFTGKPRLRYVDLAVSYSCNLNCIHCSASYLEDKLRREMSVEDYKLLSRQLIKNGVLVIQLTGGEPLLRPDLEDIIKALNPSRFFISVGTNSTLVTWERLKSLKKAGLDNFCISIDDWSPQEHDRWRKQEGSYSQAKKVLDMVLELGFTAMVFTVATHQNIRSKNFINLIEYTKKRNVLLLIGWAVPVGNWNANRDVLLTKDDLMYLESIHEKYLHVRTDFESNYFHFGCGAVKEKLNITPYGDVMPCVFVHINLGNIFEKPLEEIRKDTMKITWFRRYNPLCLAANDKEFRSQHMSKIFVSNKGPISLDEAGFYVNG